MHKVVTLVVQVNEFFTEILQFIEIIAGKAVMIQTGKDINESPELQFSEQQVSRVIRNGPDNENVHTECKRCLHLRKINHSQANGLKNASIYAAVR